MDKDELIRKFLEMMRANNEFLVREFSENLKQKHLWIAQIITIASAILGGFLLSQRQENLIIKIGLSLLFLVIFVGLILIYKENKKSLDRLTETSGKSADYYMRCLIYFNLSDKQSLTQEETKTKSKIEDYFSKFFKDVGVLKENGSLGSVYEKFQQDSSKIDWANYFLIVGFFATGLILTFSDYIACYFGIK